MNGEDEVSQLMQMQDLEVRRRCTSEQFGFEAAEEKLDESGKVNLMESGKLQELYADDVERVLSSVGCGGPLLSDTASNAITSFETGDDVASVFSEAENYDCWLSAAPVSEPYILNEVIHITGQQPEDASQFFNIAPRAVSYDSGGIVTSFMELYSPSPHTASTSASVPSSVAVQGPLSPSSVTGTMLQQLTIEATPMAVSGHSGPPLMTHFAPNQVQQQTAFFNIVPTLFSTLELRH